MKEFETVRSWAGVNVINNDYLFVIRRNRQRSKFIKRDSCGIDDFLWDKGSKFSSHLGSVIKILGKRMGSVMRKYTSLRLCCPVQVQAFRLTAASLEEVRKFPFANRPNNDATIANLAEHAGRIPALLRVILFYMAPNMVAFPLI